MNERLELGLLILKAWVRNLDGRCATCSRLLPDEREEYLASISLGEDEEPFELDVCEPCARDIEASLLLLRKEEGAA